MSGPITPWIYPYIEDAKPRGAPFPDQQRLRPAVSITFIGPGGETTAVSLVDSGSNHVLAAPWIGQTIGVDLSQTPESYFLVGGGERLTRFAEVTLRLDQPPCSDGEPISWRADVGFFDTWEPTWPAVMGQVGFYDVFTVTMSRLAMILVVEDAETIDRRYEIQPSGGEPSPLPRFEP